MGLKLYRIKAGDADDDMPTVGAIIQGAHLSWCGGCGCFRLNHGKDFTRMDGKQLCPKCEDAAQGRAGA